MKKKKRQSLQDNLPLGLARVRIIFDDSGNPLDYQFLECNAEFEKAINLKKSEIQNKYASELFKRSKRNLKKTLALFREINSEGSSRTFYYLTPRNNIGIGARAFSSALGEISILLDPSPTTTTLEETKGSEYKDSIQVAEGMFDLVYTTNSKCEYLQVGSSFEILGRDKNFFVGKSVFDFLHPNDIRSFKSKFNNFVRKPSSILKIECSKRKIDGQYICFLIAITPVFNSKGEATEFLHRAIDITKQKNAQLDLAKAKESLELIIKGTADGMWDWDLRTNELFLSKRWKEILGYEDHELKNEFITLASLIYEEDSEMVEKYVKDYLNGKEEKYSIEFRMKHKDGSIRWIFAKGEAIRNSEGIPFRMAGSHSDITERKINEQRLEENEQFQRSLLENLSVGVMIVDPVTRKIETINSFAANMVGYKAEDIIGKVCHSFICPHSISDCPICDNNISMDNSDKILLASDGREIPILKTAKKIKIGGNIRLLESFVDISLRKKAETNLQEQIELQTILMKIATKYINIDLAEIEDTLNTTLGDLAEFVKADRAYIFDYNWDANICRNTYEWCSPGTSPEIENLREVPLEFLPMWVETHKKGKAMYIPDVLALSEDDGVRQILEPQGIKSLITIPIMNGEECVGFVGFDSVAQYHTYSEREQSLLLLFAQMLVNVQIRKQADLKLKAYSSELEIKNVQLDKALAQTETARAFQELVADIAAKFVPANGSTIRRITDSALQSIGEFFNVDRSDLFLFSEDNSTISNTNEWKRDGLISKMNELQNIPFDSLPWLMERLFHRKLPVHIPNTDSLPPEAAAEKLLMKKLNIKSSLSVPIYTENRAYGFLGFDAVLSETSWSDSAIQGLSVIAQIIASELTKIEAEKNLIALKEKAESANKAKSEFLANMSHEIRTPMNSILGFSEVMLNMSENPKQKGYLKTIFDSGRILLSIINDILDLSKIEAGRMEITAETTDLRDILEEIKQLFQNKINEKKIDFEYKCDDDFPRTIIIDEIRLRQILINLVSNAIKFTNEGYVRIEVQTNDISTNGVDFKISVIDTGIGVTEEYREKIFESFTQQAGQDNKKYGGTGLGLAISKRLCEIMNGKIYVQSELGKGSIFTIEFTNIPYSKETLIRRESDSGDEDDIVFENLKILIVDDVAYNRELVKTYLENHGLVFYEADNGAAAIESAKVLLPDLILMDIRMPEMNGYEACRHLRESQDLSNIPIIAFSASAMKTDIEDISKLFSGYIRKPLRKIALFNELKKHLPYKKIPRADAALITTGSEIQSEIFEINDEMKKQFREAFFERIDRQIDFVTIDQLSELSEEMRALAQERRIPTLLKKISELKNYTEEFNFDKIAESLTDIKAIFAQ